MVPARSKRNVFQDPRHVRPLDWCRLRGFTRPCEGFPELDPEALGVLGDLDWWRTVLVGRMPIKE